MVAILVFAWVKVAGNNPQLRRACLGATYLRHAKIGATPGHFALHDEKYFADHFVWTKTCGQNRKFLLPKN